MARRLLTIGLLLTAAMWCGRAAAKPPDLPLEDMDVLTPQDPLVPVEAAAPSQPNPFPQAAEPAPAAMETPPFFLLRPSARRMIASCLLFGVHPLLTLTPTADYVDDDDAPVPTVYFESAAHAEEAPHGTLTISVGFNSDAGLTGSIEMKPAGFGAVECGELLKACWQLIPQLFDVPEPPADSDSFRPAGFINDFNPSRRITGLSGANVLADDLGIPIQQATPKEAVPDGSAESVCPWVRQQHGAARREAAAADFDLAPDVLHNLKALSQAQTLLKSARDFAGAGRVGEALGCLELAHGLCPGSRIDEAVQEAAAYLFAPIYCGSPSYDFGAEEEAEPPAAAPKAEPDCEQCPGCGGLSLCAGATVKEREIERKLMQPVSVNLHDVPLREVIDDLRSWQSVNVYVDTAALEAEEISLDHPITAMLENVSLKSTLKLILKQAHLTYVVKDEVLQITTERGARGKMQSVVYTVADLLKDDLHCANTPETTKKSPEAALIKLITTTICPTEWCESGGPGIIVFEPITCRLLVSQTADVQEQVADLLAGLRRKQHPDEEEEYQGDAHGRACEILKACRAAMEAGHVRQAAVLARQAFALDPDSTAADPLVYKMHLAGDDAAPAPITPCLPPVDPETPAALDQLYHESLRSAHAGGEEQEPPAAEPPHGSFEFGVGLDGSVQMFGQLRRGGAIWHLFFGNGGAAVWSVPDGGADPAPSPEKTPDFGWDY